ncbi:MAG: hypothetical protein ACE5Q6_04525, partial [Dehalococcoidia bacterium]
EIEEGRNHLWNGSDRSIATNAAFLQSPGTGVVQVDYYTGDSGVLPPQYEGKFFMVVSGNPIALRRDSPPQVLVFDYGFRENRMLSVPETFLRYRGNHNQVLAGVQVGPDGLYIVPLLPDPSGRSAIFKVQHSPGHLHPLVLGEDTAPHILLREKSCLGCHTIDDRAGGRIGPELNRQLLEQRLEPRLNSAAYLEELGRVDSLNREPFNSFTAARQELRGKTGEDRLKTWTKYRIMEPRFDNPNAQMPNLGLTEAEAEVIANHLLRRQEQPGLVERTLDLLPERLRQNLAFFLVVGIFLGGVFTGLGFLLAPRLFRMRTPVFNRLTRRS